MAAIVHKWERFMAIGCTHGHLIHKENFRKVMEFKKKWKPTKVFHLGDVLDTAAFRSGAKGTKDECEPIGPDRYAARDLLLEYEPNVITWGNHEWRLWELAEHPNAIVAHAASGLRDDLVNIANKLKAETRDYHIDEGWYDWCGTAFGHGYMYNINSIAEHARKIGRCVIAHLHRTGSESADRRGGDRAWCTGLIGDRKRMHYAHRRPGYFRWNPGIVYGEGNGKQTVIWMAEGPREGEWRLPI